MIQMNVDLDYTQGVEYQNAYPTMIPEQVYSDEEIEIIESTFLNILLKTIFLT